MEKINIDCLVEEIKKCVAKHKLEKPGEYSRWLWGDRNLGVNEYGCADAANIMYTVGNFPKNREEREGFVEAMQNMQEPDTGLWREATHHFIHTTAHISAALELFDASPKYKCTALEQYSTPDGIRELLEKEVDWSNPWPQSHKGAGIYACLKNTGAMTNEWREAYFSWLWEHTSPKHGFIEFTDAQPPLYQSMAGGFHYFFNHEFERRPMRYPEKVIDSCIDLMNNELHGEKKVMIQKCQFIELDVVYSLNRAMRQSPHRFYEAKAVLEDFAEKYIEMMLNLDYETNESFNDMHMLFGAVSCLAEIQAALPGKVITSHPLRIVLDRRPFV